MVQNGAFDVERVFIGGGGNRIANNVSSGACGLISFGSQNAVSIFSPQTAKILTTLPGHKASVNCTHWLPSNKFAFKSLPTFLLFGIGTSIVALLAVFGHFTLSRKGFVLRFSDNNFLPTLSKPNIKPNGIDFKPSGGNPTGRYTKGRTIGDIVGEELGQPRYAVPFLNPNSTGEVILLETLSERSFCR